MENLSYERVSQLDRSVTIIILSKMFLLPNSITLFSYVSLCLLRSAAFAQYGGGSGSGGSMSAGYRNNNRGMISMFGGGNMGGQVSRDSVPNQQKLGYTKSMVPFSIPMKIPMQTSMQMVMPMSMQRKVPKTTTMMMMMPVKAPADGVHSMRDNNKKMIQQDHYRSTAMNEPTFDPVRAAIQSTHTYDFRDVHVEPLNVTPQTILVEANNIPLNILFQSKSSELNLQSEHVPSQGSSQETQSEDEPHHLIHRVTKPIVQEVFELIMPYRKITQQIEPVKEEIQTIIARSTVNDNKYEAENNNGNNNKNGVNSKEMQQQLQMSIPRSYGAGGINEGNNFAEVMKALNIEMSKKAYIPATMNYGMQQTTAIEQQPQQQMQQFLPKQKLQQYHSSKMQMYINQLNEQQQQQYQPQQMSEIISEQETEPDLIMPKSIENKMKAMPMMMLDMGDEDASKRVQEKISSNSITSNAAVASDEKAASTATIDATDASSLPTALQAEREKMVQSLMFYGAGVPLTGVKATSPSVNAALARSFAQTNNYANSPAEPRGY